MKLDLLAIAAHPDDAELSCSGTLILHQKKGCKTGVVDLTRGELGTRGNAELRAKEAEAATQILGLSVRENLGLRDGFFTVDETSLMAVIRCIRKYQPEIILANAVTDRHPDHGRASSLVREAVFLSGLVKVQTESDGKQQQPWRPRAVYFYIQDRQLKPDIVVDISSVMDERTQAILCYSSQFYDPGSQEPETAISSKQFLDIVRSRAVDLGRQIGVAYAEGFNTERVPGISDLRNLL